MPKKAVATESLITDSKCEEYYSIINQYNKDNYNTVGGTTIKTGNPLFFMPGVRSGLNFYTLE